MYYIFGSLLQSVAFNGEGGGNADQLGVGVLGQLTNKTPAGRQQSNTFSDELSLGGLRNKMAKDASSVSTTGNQLSTSRFGFAKLVDSSSIMKIPVYHASLSVTQLQSIICHIC